MPPVAAIVGGIGSLLGGAAVGAAGLAGTAASVIGSAAVGTVGLGVGAASGLVSGIGSLFAGPAAGVTVGESMAAQAVPAYYETAGAGVLGNIISAVPKTIGYLGEMAPAIGGLYSVIKPPAEKAVIPTSRAPVPTVSAPAIAKSPLPIFSQSPQVMTVGGPAEKTAGPNYMIYIALAVLAFILLRKK